MPNTKSAYWQEMKDHAATNIARVADDHEPETENELKERVADVLKHGTCKDAAEVIVEAIEYMVSCHMMKAHTIQA